MNEEISVEDQIDRLERQVAFYKGRYKWFEKRTKQLLVMAAELIDEEDYPTVRGS